jgi:hypothetical protein
MAPLPFAKFSKCEIADRYTNQPQYADTLHFQQAPNMAVAPFIEHDFQPRVFLTGA